MKKVYVLYHANCNDGFTAAFVVHKFYENIHLPKPEFIPVVHGKPLPEMDKGSIVYILDFSYSKEVIESMNKEYDVTVLDHHKTALELSDVPRCVIDMNRSGARMAFDYFFPAKETPRSILESSIEKLVNYVQDNDIWKHELLFTKEVNSYIFTFERTFENWDILTFKLSSDFEEVCKIGESLLQQNESNAKLISSGAKYNEVAGFRYAICNTPIYQSRIGNLLVEDLTCDFAVLYSYSVDDEGNDKLRLSLRSLQGRENEIDVSELCKYFGGGGHKNASGIPSNKFSSMKDFLVELDGALILEVIKKG